MKREPRTEVVSVRLTKAEREGLDRLGGPTAALRRLLTPPKPEQIRYRVNRQRPVGASAVRVLWFDGTTGQQWPASRSAGSGHE